MLAPLPGREKTIELAQKTAQLPTERGDVFSLPGIPPLG
jgi:hypothetical protein